MQNIFTKSCFLIFLALFFTTSINAQNRVYAGANAAAMGNAVVTVADEWAMFNNIGALASYNRLSAVVGFDNRFSVAGLNTLNAGLSLPLNLSFGGIIGATAMRFGDNIYNEQQIGIGYGHKIQGVSLGAKVNYVQIAIEGLGVRRALTYEFGGAVQLTNVLFLGMHIYNFTQAKITQNEESRLPTVMKAGLSYRPMGEKLMLNAEIEKEGDFTARAKFGVSYWLTKSLSVRTGVTTAPFKGCFGVSWRLNKIGFDYALNTHQTLMMSHHVSFVYFFGKDNSLPKEAHKSH